MRQTAIAVAAVLVLALVSPAFAQPFADTPTNHWAYDAIAELAAKGLIEGYPDGTFKGDRAMTRYEMAMVVARLLARIESIQIPTPPPPPKPEVTKADIDMILRLVNEFRAELAAKNVRLTAVEEELNAIKAKLDNVRITGAVRMRYDMYQYGPNQRSIGSAPLIVGNNNPLNSTTAATTQVRSNRVREIFRMQFDGSVAPDVHFITVLSTCSNCGSSSSVGSFSYFTFNSSTAPIFGGVDVAFFDWKNAFGVPLEIWVGRFGGISPGPTYPVQFGPFGLLLNTGGDTWEDSTNDSGNNSVDGIRMALHLASIADLQLQALWVRVTGNGGVTGSGAFSFPSGEDMYGGDVNIKIFEGFRVGVYYVGNAISNAGSSPFTGPSPFGTLYHLYGPGGGSINPGAVSTTPQFGSGLGGLRCIASATGINCPALGNGWGAYVMWDILPGIHLDVEAAQWNDQTPGGGNDSGANVVATFDLGTLVDLKGLTFTAGYSYYGPNFYSPYGAAESDIFGYDGMYPGNAQGFTGTVAWSINPTFTVFANYFTGNSVNNSQPETELDTGIAITIAPRTRVTLRYRDVTVNGIDQLNFYRAQFDYSW
jgi:hypothetical protein